MSRPVIILGAGGHAGVLISALRLRKVDIAGLTDADPGKAGQLVLGIAVIGADDAVEKYATADIDLVNGLGSVRADSRREAIFEKFVQYGYRFASVIHPSAMIADKVSLGTGAQIMMAAIVQTGCRIDDNALVNTAAIIEHDCLIGSHVHVASGATLCGGVEVGTGSHIGAGATVIQGVRIGRYCQVAAGAVVVRDVPDRMKVAGVPAREMI
jgi:sugar O-acyltransferase (sialic acid O-acetyltransferase NeuD family)